MENLLKSEPRMPEQALQMRDNILIYILLDGRCEVIIVGNI